MPHRVRYSARGMEEAHDAGPVEEDEPLVDHYELAFWPAEPAPDAIIRQTSSTAQYWHNTCDPVKGRAQKIQGRWGDHPPSERLIDVLSARWLVERDRDLAEELGAAQPGVQRAMVLWAIRRACEEAGLAELDWVGVTEP